MDLSRQIELESLEESHQPQQQKFEHLYLFVKAGSGKFRPVLLQQWSEDDEIPKLHFPKSNSHPAKVWNKSPFVRWDILATESGAAIGGAVIGEGEGAGEDVEVVEPALPLIEPGEDKNIASGIHPPCTNVTNPSNTATSITPSLVMPDSCVLNLPKNSLAIIHELEHLNQHRIDPSLAAAATTATAAAGTVKGVAVGEKVEGEGESSKTQKRSESHEPSDDSEPLAIAGYCENCRAKFNHLEVHRLTKRHQRIAKDLSYWREVDELLFDRSG